MLQRTYQSLLQPLRSRGAFVPLDIVQKELRVDPLLRLEQCPVQIQSIPQLYLHIRFQVQILDS